jgi:outer membrane protein assembly factor BamB
MRRKPLLAIAVIASFVLAACARSDPGPASKPAPEDVLFVRTARGVTLVTGLPEGVAVRLPDAVPSIDWSAVVRAIPQGRQTQVVALDTSSGEELWSQEVQGTFEVKVASQNGQMVALGRPGGGTGYPDGRSSTTLVIIGEDGSEPRTIYLKGNYEPEAFSTDGGSLFVIEYIPPRAPTAYRVRRLDLRTGEVGGVYTVDAELQTAMQGTARIQTASPDGRRLYTLYSLEDADGDLHSFVHVLSLDQEWAHCVDLPSDFRTEKERAVAMSVSPDGSNLYVADVLTGDVAEIDTTALRVTQTAQLPLGPWGRDPAHAARGADGTLYLGSGTGLHAIDAATFSPGASWDFEQPIMGIQAGSDGRRLYVGLPDRIAVIDTASGRGLEALQPERVEEISQLGTSTRIVELDTRVGKCAC